MWADKRIPSLPDVPRFIELGFKDVEFYIWAGLFAPKGVPDGAMTALRKAAGEAVRDSAFVAAMEKLASPITYMDAPEFRKFWDADYARLAAALKKIGKVQ